MTFFKTIALAFSMFSSLPVPNVEWNEKNMKYMLCAFPLVGVLTAVVLYAWVWIVLRLHAPNTIAALGCTLVPVLVSGGIHLDGFCDTCDALASHADREKKLEILKDSHSGAFAVIGTVIYFLSYYVISLSLVKTLRPVWPVYPFYPGLFAAAGRGICAFACVFVIERTFSALAVAVFPCAKNSGLVHSFADASSRYVTRVFCICLLIILFSVAVIFSGRTGIAVLVADSLFFIYYYSMTKSEFGGITGDLAGWYVQMNEIISLAVIVLAERFL